MGVLALAVGMQVAMSAIAEAAIPLERHVASVSAEGSSVLSADALSDSVLVAQTYTPPDNGGPDTSQGSGTR